MKIKLVVVGKLKEPFLKDMCNEYIKRLSPYANVEVFEVPDELPQANSSLKDEENCRNKEGEKILSKIKDNEYVYLYNNNQTPILLIGLDTNINLENAFKYEDNNNYKIVLSHYPDNFNLINDKNINLFLSGNSLNGQVRLPFLGGIIKKDGSKKYYDEKYYINNTNIFISNGLGNPKYDIRLLNTPSINFYRLYSK